MTKKLLYVAYLKGREIDQDESFSALADRVYAPYNPWRLNIKIKREKKMVNRKERERRILFKIINDILWNG